MEWTGIKNPPPIELNKNKTLTGYNKPINSEVKHPEFSQSPKNIPPIFDGNQLVVFGMFSPDHDKPTGVKIIANSPDGPLSLEIPVSVASKTNTLVIYCMFIFSSLLKTTILERHKCFIN